jgi:hypothetical protein
LGRAESISLQYGYDAFANLTSTGFVPPESRHTWRVTDAYTFQPNEHFAMQAVFLYQNSKNATRGASFGLQAENLVVNARSHLAARTNATR